MLVSSESLVLEVDLVLVLVVIVLESPLPLPLPEQVFPTVQQKPSVVHKLPAGQYEESSQQTPVDGMQPFPHSFWPAPHPDGVPLHVFPNGQQPPPVTQAYPSGQFVLRPVQHCVIYVKIFAILDWGDEGLQYDRPACTQYHKRHIRVDKYRKPQV